MRSLKHAHKQPPPKYNQKNKKDTLDAVVAAAKAKGSYDAGIQQIRATSALVRDRRPIHTDPVSGAETSYMQVCALFCLLFLCLSFWVCDDDGRKH